jgi:hypothetical protein
MCVEPVGVNALEVGGVLMFQRPYWGFKNQWVCSAGLPCHANLVWHCEAHACCFASALATGTQRVIPDGPKPMAFHNELTVLCIPTIHL